MNADSQESIDDEYIVFGYPESGSHFWPNPKTRNIRQKSFTLHTGIAAHMLAAREKIDLTSHLALAFDPEKITVGGKRLKPPDPTGISGGAAFHVIDKDLKLAGIMTEQRPFSRLMVSVRMSEVIAIAQHAVSLNNKRGA